MSPGTGAQPRSPRLAWAIALTGLLLQTVAVGGAAVLAIVQEIQGEVGQLRAGLGVALFYVVIAVGLAAVARGVYRRRRWATAPAITVQLFLGFALARPLLQAGHQGPGVIALVLALATLAALVVNARTLPLPRRFTS